MQREAVPQRMGWRLSPWGGRRWAEDEQRLRRELGLKMVKRLEVIEVEGGKHCEMGA
jgi:hypothetical protein